MRISDWSSDVCSSDLLSTSARAQRGLVRTFQSNLLFSEQTALENVASGALGTRSRQAFDWLFERPAQRVAIEATGREILEFCGLGDKVDVPAGDLSHGQQRVLGMSIALAARPRQTGRAAGRERVWRNVE